VFECFAGVLVGLFGELVSGEVVSLFVSGCSGLVGVSGEIVKFDSAIVLAGAHGGFPFAIWMQDGRLKRRPSCIRLAAHPAAVYGDDASGDVVAGG
jgi:hypothetical protein